MSEVDKNPNPLPAGWEIDPQTPDKKADGKTRGRGLVTTLIVAAMTVVVGLVAGLKLGLFDRPVVEVPVLTAEQTPIKERPEDPGGTDVPDQDKEVYNRLGENAEKPTFERLLPPPEAPAMPPQTATPAAPPEAPPPPPAPPATEPPALVLPQEPIFEPPLDAAPLRFPDDPEPPPQQAADTGSSTETGTERKLPEIRAIDEPVSAPVVKRAPMPKVEPTPESAPEMAAKEPIAAPVVKSAPAPKVEPTPESAPVMAAKEPVAAPVVESAPTPEVTPPPRSAPKVAAVPETAPPAAPAATPTGEVISDVRLYGKTIPKGAYVIQVAALRDQGAAKALGRKLHNAHSDILGSMSVFALRADLGDRGLYYRVRFGPLPSAAAARNACNRLKSRKQDCLVVKF